MSELHPTAELSAKERSALIGAMTPADAAEVPQLHEVEVPDELRERIETLVGRYPEVRSASIPALFEVQRRYGWCTPEGIRQAAAVMGVSPGYLQSVASFYDLLHIEPSGRHRVLVCTNISCWMRGADELLDRFCELAGVDSHEASHGGETSADGELFISGFECLGACDIAPMASIDERYYGPLGDAEALTAIEQLRAGEEVLPNLAVAGRRLAGGSEHEPDARIREDEEDGRDEARDRTPEADNPPEDQQEAAGAEIRHPQSEQTEGKDPEE